jgi:hypothetical protein
MNGWMDGWMNEGMNKLQVNKMNAVFNPYLPVRNSTSRIVVMA